MLKNVFVLNMLRVRTVFALSRRSLQERARERQRLVAPNDVHLEVGLALHFTQFRFAGAVLLDFRLIFGIHGVVDIERDHDPAMQNAY